MLPPPFDSNISNARYGRSTSIRPSRKRMPSRIERNENSSVRSKAACAAFIAR